MRATIEFLNIDGSTIGSADIPLEEYWREAMERTIGDGYQARINLPVPDIGDPRCPYGLNFRLETLCLSTRTAS